MIQKTKQEEMNGLVTAIRLYQRLLTHKEKEHVEALEYGLTTRLNELLKECQEREMDLKIEQMKKVLDILKHNPNNL